MFLALTLSLLSLAPQKPAEASQGGEKVILSARDQKSLGDKLRKYLDAEIAYDQAEGKAREKAAKARRKNKQKFETDWKKAEDKGAMRSMGDLRAIFYNCFTNSKPDHGNGRMYARKVKDRPWEYGIFVPKKYSVKTPWTTLLVLPDGKGGTWTKPADYFTKVWEKTEPMASCIVHIPLLPQGLEMDQVPDYSREGAEQEEDRRLGAVFGSFGYTINNYNVARSQVFLDCGRETCGYGTRLATVFPERFAGLILRDPIEVDDIRIGSLMNLPVLLLKTKDNAAKVAAFQKRFDEKCPGMVTVLDAKGAYPHLESAADIAEWMKDKKRNMSPAKVVLEPNHDRFNRAYWVDILRADSLQATAADEKPRMEVTADREANRITIDCRGVERFELLLNDDLLDLDKEFTIVVNGKAIKETRGRSFLDMKNRMIERNDWGYLFSVRYVTSVPKE